MLVKLVQDDVEGRLRTVDIASSINKLDFSGLSGSGAWQVYVIWDTREECIARVIWEPSMVYQIGVRHDGAISAHPFTIGCMSIIVPTVKGYLERLFQSGRINPIYRHQPMVVVQPDMGVA